LIPAILVSIVIAGTGLGLTSEMPLSYNIEVSLDTTSRFLQGKEKVVFHNPTNKALERICFHLYPNAFSDTNSVYCREDLQARDNVEKGYTSKLNISNVSIEGALIADERITIDGTLAYIDLPQALPPARELQFEMEFSLEIPKTISRFGHDGRGDYLFAHWYPAVAGYQNGELIDAEYHANSEFFSNFGFYDVTMKLPANMIVGSTGQLSLAESSDTLAVWNARADSVIDFAFACGENFKRFESDTLGVKIHYLLTENGSEQLTALDEITRYSLGYCGDVLFDYPYSDFTVVEFRSGSAGMELPGMIVLAIPEMKDSKRVKAPESLVAHETIHQWFYGMIASNETDEPWLDEGLTTYLTTKLMDSRPASQKEQSFFGIEFDYDDIRRIFTLSSHASYPVSLKSYDYPGWAEYETAVYYRAAFALQALDISVGDSVFTSALKTYANTYRFKHPTTEDFKNTVRESTRKELDGFYSQFIDGTSRVDYAITSLDFEKVGADSADFTGYSVKVGVRRELDGILPQVVTVKLEDGSEISSDWDGVDKVAEFEFTSRSKPLYAALDENSRYLLDEDISNDRLYIETHSLRFITFDWDMASIMEFILAFFL